MSMFNRPDKFIAQSPYCLLPTRVQPKTNTYKPKPPYLRTLINPTVTMAMSYAYSTEQRKQVSRRDAPGVAFSEIPVPAVTGESCDPVTRKNQQCGQGVPYSTGQATGERKKYFTQKYGQHQMQLIRKRLAVEEWLDENLRILYAVVCIASSRYVM